MEGLDFENSAGYENFFLVLCTLANTNKTRTNQRNQGSMAWQNTELAFDTGQSYKLGVAAKKAFYMVGTIDEAFEKAKTIK